MREPEGRFPLNDSERMRWIVSDTASMGDDILRAMK